VDALVDVTGVCSVQSLDNGHPQSYRLLLRGDDDVRLVEGPPWWTRGRVMAALILVTSILLFSWLWVGALQRTVRRQTAVIQTKLGPRSGPRGAVSQAVRERQRHRLHARSRRRHNIPESRRVQSLRPVCQGGEGP